MESFLASTFFFFEDFAQGMQVDLTKKLFLDFPIQAFTRLLSFALAPWVRTLPRGLE
jgi:hypothetical protein